MNETINNVIDVFMTLNDKFNLTDLKCENQQANSIALLQVSTLMLLLDEFRRVSYDLSLSMNKICDAISSTIMHIPLQREGMIYK